MGVEGVFIHMAWIDFSNRYMGVIGVMGVSLVIPTVTAVPICDIFLCVMGVM